MRIVIAGATKLGATLAARLIETGAEVVLIDKDGAALDALADRLDCGMIRGDATLPSTLREAAGEDADVLVALTHSDEDNILCAVVGRSVGYARVIPQIAETELGAICEELELTDFITPDETIASSLIAAIEDGSCPMRASPLCGDMTLSAFEVANALAGRPADGVEMPAGARLIAVAREGVDMFADDAGELKAGDALVLLVKREDLRAAIAGLADQDKRENEEERA